MVSSSLSAKHGGGIAYRLGWVLYLLACVVVAFIESIMTVRNLTNGRTWTPEDVEKALSPYALTSVMMARFHIVEKVRRALGSEISRPAKAA